MCLCVRMRVEGARWTRPDTVQILNTWCDKPRSELRDIPQCLTYKTSQTVKQIHLQCLYFSHVCIHYVKYVVLMADQFELVPGRRIIQWLKHLSFKQFSVNIINFILSTFGLELLACISMMHCNAHQNMFCPIKDLYRVTNLSGCHFFHSFLLICSFLLNLFSISLYSRNCHTLLLLISNDPWVWILREDFNTF